MMGLTTDGKFKHVSTFYEIYEIYEILQCVIAGALPHKITPRVLTNWMRLRLMRQVFLHVYDLAYVIHL